MDLLKLITNLGGRYLEPASKTVFFGRRLIGCSTKKGCTHRVYFDRLYFHTSHNYCCCSLHTFHLFICLFKPSVYHGLYFEIHIPAATALYFPSVAKCCQMLPAVNPRSSFSPVSTLYFTTIEIHFCVALLPANTLKRKTHFSNINISTSSTSTSPLSISSR